ncbi:MAG TPA: hypothetical protein VND24_03395 [Steroidobacteraceae bacterium]|nr:hypothetical protein [Steroidobacteraceae bacterium]
MTTRDETTETFWDLLADVGRLQAKLSETFVAWAQANEANARAFQRNAETLQLMVEIGRRAEQSMRQAPSTAARLALQFLADPMQAMGTPSAAAAGDPFARFWEAWRAAAESRNPSHSERRQ